MTSSVSTPLYVAISFFFPHCLLFGSQVPFYRLQDFPVKQPVQLHADFPVSQRGQQVSEPLSEKQQRLLHPRRRGLVRVHQRQCRRTRHCQCQPGHVQRELRG